MGESEKHSKQSKALVGTGLVVIFIAVFADQLGLGQAAGFGFKQLALLVVGVGVTYFGVKHVK